ncbi:hypothetical protein [Natrarchaeobaculum aegyptiacum]|uniref:Uncharacterized protein n=1 Tax=Natrarchaeobaculum aegyptiacum TaxID=745377 RepID=A0A2Z2HUF7_9EURY|nr:hypothetical protein [Natrarchaeobaculum aegyptiacum]ARS89137.1 hypothetical protein B1756_04790 [Natrarchaeobaculum aegyptiacum]
MNRRPFLEAAATATFGAGTAVLTGVGLAGCLEEGEEDVGPPEDDHGDCPEQYGIFVGLPESVPPDADVLDAEAAGVTDLEATAETLAVAHDEYDDGMEDEIDEYEHLAEGIDGGELADELPEQEAYVTYRNVTFRVSTHVELQC